MQQNFGGPHSQEKAEWMVDATEQWFNENGMLVNAHALFEFMFSSYMIDEVFMYVNQLQLICTQMRWRTS